MATITVLRPDQPAPPAPPAELAPRRAARDGAVLALIENGKPHARDLLQMVAAELRGPLGLADVLTFSKPSASRPIAEDEARMLAARSHLVVTGVGD
jgi:hypothetical protein